MTTYCRQRSFLSLLVLLAAIGAPLQASEPSGTALVDALVGDLLEVTGLPGFSVAIIAADGEIWARGYGVADVAAGTKVTTTTRFRAASVSKTITMTALAALVEDGKLDLDAPIGTYVADFPDPQQGITVRRLAGHLAGIAHYQGADKVDRGHFYSSMDESLSVFRDSPRAGAPGERYQYSTHGFTLLSAAMEHAAGKPFLDVLEDEVFAPLGMTGSGPDLRSSPSPDMTTLYNVVKRKTYPIPKPEDPSFKWAGGGLVSTPTDLVKMARAYWNGHVSAELVAEMWTSQQTAAGTSTGVGIGWRIGEGLDGQRVIHHAGAMGGARSLILMYPEEHRAIATLTNATWPGAAEANGQLLLAAFDAAPTETKGASEAYAYEGTYVDADGSFAVEGQLDLAGGTGTLTMPQPFKDWVRLAVVDQMPLRRIAGDRWALVTPFGLAELELRSEGDGWVGEAQLSPSRRFRFTAAP